MSNEITRARDELTTQQQMRAIEAGARDEFPPRLDVVDYQLMRMGDHLARVARNLLMPTELSPLGGVAEYRALPPRGQYRRLEVVTACQRDIPIQRAIARLHGPDWIRVTDWEHVENDDGGYLRAIYQEVPRLSDSWEDGML